MADKASYLSSYFVKMTIGKEYDFKIYSYDSSFLHKVTIKCGNYSKIIDRVKGGVETTFTIPMTWCNASPNAMSLNGTITCQTYKSNYSTKVGSADVETATFSIPASVIPNVEASIEEAVDGIAEQFGAYVQGKSKITMNITGTGIYGSTIKSYHATVNGATYTKSSFTTGVLKLDADVDYTYRQWSVNVTDSRGQYENLTKSYKILSYHNPKINSFSIVRCNADGTENDEGTFVKVTSSASIKPCYDGTSNRNTKAFKLSYKLTTEDTWTDIDITGDSYSLEDERVLSDFDINSTYNFKIEATDFFGTSSKIVDVGTSNNLMDFHYSGNGMAVGKASEEEGVFDVGYQTKLTGGLKPVFLEANTDLNDVITPNFYTGQNISSYNYGNCPLLSGTFYLEVVSCGEEGQVRQTITSCEKNNPITYERFYYQNSWGGWHDFFKASKQIATIVGNGDTTLATTDITQINMKSSVLIGSKLSVTNGQIIVGANVKYIKISASIYAYNGFTEGDLVHLNITKNDSVMLSQMKRISGTYETVTSATKIISAVEGDVIKLCARNQTEARGLISGSANATYMTVEVVE